MAHIAAHRALTPRGAATRRQDKKVTVVSDEARCPCCGVAPCDCDEDWVISAIAIVIMMMNVRVVIVRIIIK